MILFERDLCLCNEGSLLNIVYSCCNVDEISDVGKFLFGQFFFNSQ